MLTVSTSKFGVELAPYVKSLWRYLTEKENCLLHQAQRHAAKLSQRRLPPRTTRHIRSIPPSPPSGMGSVAVVRFCWSQITGMIRDGRSEVACIGGSTQCSKNTGNPLKAHFVRQVLLLYCITTNQQKSFNEPVKYVMILVPSGWRLTWTSENI